MTGERLTAWESDTLRILSTIYAIETMKSMKEDYRCPIDFETKADKNARIEAVFRGMV